MPNWLEAYNNDECLAARTEWGEIILFIELNNHDMVSVASWFYVWFNYIINIKILILLLNNNKSDGK